MNSSELALRVRDLRKAYRVYPRPIDPLLELIGRGRRHIERVVLDRINLDIGRGEIVGILGRNGAGKSTLLRIIAGTLEKTSGELEINGRITAILELGTGFHPDHTGRENIFMGGMCLGMSRAEVESKIEEIIDFSELREVIDQPFKTYSTGMQARLTFSTAISVEPDILIVDEALSVGDARFQMKCFAWIERLKQRNSTVILVSHDTNTITTFCDRALILENGRIFSQGEAKAMTVTYHKLLFAKTPTPVTSEIIKDLIPSGPPPLHITEASSTSNFQTSGMRYGSKEAELIDWGITDELGSPLSVISSGVPCRLSMRFTCHADIDDMSVGFAIKDRKGTVVWGITNLSQDKQAYVGRCGEVMFVSCSCIMWLAAGEFFVTLGIAHLQDGEKIDFIEQAIQFTITGPGNIFTTSIVNLEGNLTIDRISPS